VSRIRIEFARLLRMDPGRTDAGIAALLAIGALIELAPVLHRSHHPDLTVVMVVLAAATVAWRRRRPFLAAAAALILLIGYQSVALVRDYGLFLLLAIALEIYSVAAHVPGRRGWAAGGVLLALVNLAVATGQSPRPVDFLWATGILFGLPFAVGRTLLNRRALTAELRAKATAMEQEREERAKAAAAEERARVARELHDVLAHSVSVMVIQAGAARRVAPADREGAREALRAVQTSGREALAEMRRMVGVMRRSDADADPHTPGLGQLVELVARARAAGLPVELRVEGVPGPLPAGVDLAAYRLVQEALTNTIKHAGPARALVHVHYGPKSLELEVSDTGRGPADARAGCGHGLTGMRERIALYDGELETGRRRGGGFSVRARIPHHDAPA
jgi:signal transduction histidine kinase